MGHIRRETLKFPIMQLEMQILTAANFVCNLCNSYLQPLQSFASFACKYLQSLQIKVSYLTTKGCCNYRLQALYPECNWIRNTTKSCVAGNKNIYIVVMVYHTYLKYFILGRPQAGRDLKFRFLGGVYMLPGNLRRATQNETLYRGPCMLPGILQRATHNETLYRGP